MKTIILKKPISGNNKYKKNNERKKTLQVQKKIVKYDFQLFLAKLIKVLEKTENIFLHK